MINYLVLILLKNLCLIGDELTKLGFCHIQVRKVKQKRDWLEGVVHFNTTS